MESQDLVAFRIALRELSGVLPAEERRKEVRYTPTGPLSRAKVQINAGTSKLEADVVDLSPSGMRLAVGPGVACAEGDQCTIEITLHLQKSLSLKGEVRWVNHHPFITVFGVLLDPDSNPLQAV